MLHGQRHRNSFAKAADSIASKTCRDFVDTVFPLCPERNPVPRAPSTILPADKASRKDRPAVRPADQTQRVPDRESFPRTNGTWKRAPAADSQDPSAASQESLS